MKHLWLVAVIAVGGLTGDTSEQVKGKAKEMEGKAQRKVGEAEVKIDRNT